MAQVVSAARGGDQSPGIEAAHLFTEGFQFAGGDVTVIADVMLVRQIEIPIAMRPKCLD